jgi:DNA processing protein
LSNKIFFRTKFFAERKSADKIFETYFFCLKFFVHFYILFFVDVLDIAISSILFLSLREKILLKKNVDSIDKLALLSTSELSTIVGRAPKRAVWNAKDVCLFAEKSFAVMQSKNIKSAAFYEDDFPVMLKTVADSPYAIFYRGNLDCIRKPCVSVVGTRNVCQETATAAFEFARDASLFGQCVVSGLANGIDSFAHRGALASERSSSTAAVVPCGIETVVPYSNRRLAEKILSDGGCILGEYAPGVPAEKWRFVQRNRIVAALSSCTLVVHGPAGSGSLITAEFALDYNRDVFFHAAGFCEEARRKENCKSEKSGSFRSSKKFLEEGAPVIKNYADFVSALNDAPGTHICKKKIQTELL